MLSHTFSLSLCPSLLSLIVAVLVNYLARLFHHSSPSFPKRFLALLLLQHFKDLIRLRRTAEWPRSSLDTEAAAAAAAKEAPEVELLPFTLSHERCISVVQKLALFLLSMDFTCHADLLLFVCKV